MLADLALVRGYCSLWVSSPLRLCCLCVSAPVSLSRSCGSLSRCSLTSAQGTTRSLLIGYETVFLPSPNHNDCHNAGVALIRDIVTSKLARVKRCTAISGMARYGS